MARPEDPRVGLLARSRKAIVRLWTTVMVMAGLALGISLALLLWPRTDGSAGGTYRPVPSAARLDVGTPGPLVDTPLPPADPSVEPPTARAALEAFLRAEADGRADVAHALLTDEAKKSEGPAPAWQASRPDRLVPVDFQVTGERPTAEGADFDVTATHTPVINPFVGFVPSRTQQRWRVLRQGGRWRVSPSPADAQPLFPAEGPAPKVAEAWLQRLAACDGAGATQFQVGPVVYGPLDLLGAPCQEGGTWTTAAPVGLDRGEDPRELLAAFGPDVGRFVRLVPAQGPKTSVMVAVAPLGEDWRVLGVLTAPAAGGG